MKDEKAKKVEYKDVFSVVKDLYNRFFATEFGEETDKEALFDAKLFVNGDIYETAMNFWKILNEGRNIVIKYEELKEKMPVAEEDAEKEIKKRVQPIISMEDKIGDKVEYKDVLRAFKELCDRFFATEFGEYTDKEALLQGRQWVDRSLNKIAGEFWGILDQGRRMVTGYDELQERIQADKIEDERRIRECVKLIFGKELDELQQLEGYSNMLNFIRNHIDEIFRKKDGMSHLNDREAMKMALDSVRTEEIFKNFGPLGAGAIHYLERDVIVGFVKKNIDVIERYYALEEGKKSKDAIKIAIIKAKIDEILNIAYPNWQEMDDEECMEIRSFIATHIIKLDAFFEYLRNNVPTSKWQEEFLIVLGDLREGNIQSPRTLKGINRVLDINVYGYNRTIMGILENLNPNKVEIYFSYNNIKSNKMDNTIGESMRPQDGKADDAEVDNGQTGTNQNQPDLIGNEIEGDEASLVELGEKAYGHFGSTIPEKLKGIANILRSFFSKDRNDNGDRAN